MELFTYSCRGLVSMSWCMYLILLWRRSELKLYLDCRSPRSVDEWTEFQPIRKSIDPCDFYGDGYFTLLSNTVRYPLIKSIIYKLCCLFIMEASLLILGIKKCPFLRAIALPWKLHKTQLHLLFFFCFVVFETWACVWQPCSKNTKVGNTL